MRNTSSSEGYSDASSPSRVLPEAFELRRGGRSKFMGSPHTAWKRPFLEYYWVPGYEVRSLDALRCSCNFKVAAEWAVKLASATHKRHDSYTARHSKGVSRLASHIGEEMALSSEVVWLLGLAGLVHDVGKIEVPRRIIEKLGPLTTEEFEVVKTHAHAGYEILGELPGPWPIAKIARQHHERLDGSGYPQGLKAPEILLESQILAVADVAESMLSDRPYRPAHSVANVISVIRELRTEKLNADAADACICLLTKKLR